MTDSHSRTVASELAVATSAPSGLNATTNAESVWPSRVRIGAPDAVSQSLGGRVLARGGDHALRSG